MINWFLDNFPDCPPIGYILRERFLPRWFRIHSLPESKRYHDNEVEEGILLSRHNQVATDILGENSDCLLIVTQYGNGGLIFPFLPTNHNFSRVYQYDEEEDPAAEPAISWATNITWGNHAFDQIILAVANDEAYDTLFISPSSGGIYAPYDGGVDLFHIDPARIENIRQKYQHWASRRPDGM